MKVVQFEDTPVDVLKGTHEKMVHSKISCTKREDKDDAFVVCDLGDIVRKHRRWQRELPRVRPFYAVKCNDDRVVLSMLHKLGTGFDCASKGEIQRLLRLGVRPTDMIYANPCKQASYISYAHKVKVDLMTFDNELELHKIKEKFPHARLVLRILPPDGSKALCPLGLKFGVAVSEALPLLQTARTLGLDVVGVSFHVGSGCYDSSVFALAVEAARRAFELGEQAGYSFTLLDIGGGFPGSDKDRISFEEIAEVLRCSLDEHFPASSGVEIIAEPGRFFVASAFSLAGNIIAKRGPSDSNQKYMYYINDGVYGSFNCILYDHQVVHPKVLVAHQPVGEAQRSSVWGPTCDSLDCLVSDCYLPELHQGDWLLFTDMGAYTMAAASGFNGMPRPRCYYIIQEELHDELDANDTDVVYFTDYQLDNATNEEMESSKMAAIIHASGH